MPTLVDQSVKEYGRRTALDAGLMAMPSVPSATETNAPPRPMRRVLPVTGPRAESKVCDFEAALASVCARARVAIEHTRPQVATLNSTWRRQCAKRRDVKHSRRCNRRARSARRLTDL